MTVSGIDAWVTSAVDDKNVNKALVLAGSLRRVQTSKKLVVLTTSSALISSRDKLSKAFDSVLLLEEGKGEDHAKLEAFSLMLFRKCVYLSPNTVVLRNCDEMFEKYGKFAAYGTGNEFDSSVYLFTPSLQAARTLTSMMMKMTSAHDDVDSLQDSSKQLGLFSKRFNLWIRNNIPDVEKLEGEYNYFLPSWKDGIPRSLGSKVAIANFGEEGHHPLDLFSGGDHGILQKDLGIIEKFAVELCERIYTEDVQAKPNLHSDLSLHLNYSYKTEPIAIVGMSFRLPGSNNVDQFWDLLINGKEAIGLLPQSRWRKEHTIHHCNNRKIEAGFLSVPVDEFDAKFFGISGSEAEFIDPQQRLLHEVAWEALEDSMIDPHSLRGSSTGVFVGSWRYDYHEMLGRDRKNFFRSYLGNSIGAGAARLSHFLETTGPSIGTECGCSSAIMAVDMACKSLRNRDSNLALVSAVNLLLHPFENDEMKFLISPDGRCKAFDAGASGFGRAEGCAVLVMKRFSDALREGDNIWGLIRGSAISQDGGSKSLGTPTVQSESLAMELALKDAQVDPLEISYIEAHGTGTAVGDPVEIAAITKAYSSKGRSEPLLIGSVKTNVGHTESVSGITGIIKVLLSMRNEVIPKHLNFKSLNPNIDLDAIPARLPLEKVAWRKGGDKPRIAGVSSFGITGADGHVILQEPPSVNVPQIYEDDVRPLHLIKISAKSPESLQQLLESYQAIFSSKSSKDRGFPDMAYSANIGRATFNHRAVIIASDFQEAAKIILEKTFKQAEVQSGGGSKLCFLFTGQGSQYPKMGAELYATSPVFRNEFNRCDRMLVKKYGIKLGEILWGPSSSEVELSRSLYSQTSIFCIEYCLLQLWMSWGVKPDYVMGHSLGEFAAAVAAGALDFEDALMLVAERSRLIDNLPEGKMLVIKADKETVEKNIKSLNQVNPNFWVDFAAINSPQQTVVAGDSKMIEEFAGYCAEKSLKTNVLSASHAFHSRHMDPMLEQYRKIAQTVKPIKIKKNSPKYISGMDGKLVELEQLVEAEYWVRHTRQPVNFIDACKVAQSEGISLFLELGPHPVLSALTMMNMEGSSVICLPTIRKKENEWVTTLDSLSKLYLSDWEGQVNWNGFDRYYKRSKVSLPFYPFNRKSYWKEMECDLPIVHPLLGKVIPTECDHTIFENRLALKNIPYIEDHVIGNTVVFPGAAFLEMCLAAGQATIQSGELKKPQRSIALKSLKIISPLALYATQTCRLQTTTKLEEERDNQNEMGYSIGVHRFVQSSSGKVADQWISHASAKFLPIPTALPEEDSISILVDIPVIQDTWERTDQTAFYQTLPEVGLRFGPKFRSLGIGWKSLEGILFQVKYAVEEEEDDASNYLIHPILADAMLQATMLWTSKDLKNKSGKMKLHVPVQIGEFRWLQQAASSSGILYIYCGTTGSGKTVSILLTSDGTRLAQMSGVDFIETSAGLMEGMILEQEAAMPKLWKEVWKSAPGPLQSAYDLTGTKDVPFLQFNLEQKRILTSANDVGDYERRFHKNLCSLSGLFVLNAMFELGWKPKQGEPFTVQELMEYVPCKKEHFKKYIRYFLGTLKDAGLLYVHDGDKNKFYFYGKVPSKEEINQELKRVISPEDKSRVEYRLVLEVGRNLANILSGKMDALQLLFTEDPSKPNANQLYSSGSRWMFSVLKPVNDELIAPVINHASKTMKSDGILRVLEIGAGTGSFTKPYLEYLETFGKPFEYYFTDVSASFFNAAEKKLEKFSNSLIFKKFDMEEDPLAQGLCPDYFDLILACEVIHVAKDIRKTLKNLRCLLKPGGVFQVMETTKPDPSITLSFGLLEGYWRFEDFEMRPGHVAASSKKWEEALKSINCDKVECIPVYNDIHSFIVARLDPDTAKITTSNSSPIEAPKHSWMIFYHDGNANLMNLLKEKLAGVKRKVHAVKRPAVCTEQGMKQLMKSEFNLAMEGVEGAVEGIIYLWGLAEELNRDQSQISLPFINLVQEMTECKQVPPPRLYVVTQGTGNVEGSDVSNPTSATLHGMVRSLSNEMVSLHISCLDLSPDDDQEGSGQVDRIFHDLWNNIKDKGNRNIAYRDDKRLYSKLVSAKVSNNEPLSLPSGCDRFTLVLPKTKVISDLEFGPLDNYNLKENEVEIAVKAMALNFHDVFAVIKPTAVFEKDNTVGMDFAGVVTKVGSKVGSRKVGDLVLGINRENTCLPSHIRTEEQLLLPFPSGFTWVEGAALPAVLATAIYGLILLGGMKRGETVLIHTASGGVGLSAIQIAKLVGAEVIATAGSRRKRSYLRSLGIKHVFHSRTTLFGKQILEVTNGRGVDLVLNTITGAGFKEASLSALARNGRFVELSKLSVWTKEEVKELRPDVDYQILDMTEHILDKVKHERVVQELGKYIGSIKPIPYEQFDAVNIRAALNYLQKAKHIGKIVCVMPEFKVEKCKITATTPLFNEWSTYLVTGGLGGIGFEVVKWMLNSGAKHIAIASRRSRQPKPEIASQIDYWNQCGNKHVETFSVDIGDYDQCRDLFQELKSPNRGFPQLRGVMHVAGALSDAVMENQTWSKFQHTYNPKVDGSWNLHDLTKNLVLEHFVLFSSFVAVLGSPGQSNHAASTSFEDALAAHRRSNGLSATTVNWGNWGEVGVATELDFPGFRPITTSQGLLALETFLRTQTSHVSVINAESFALAGQMIPTLKYFVEDKRLFGDQTVKVKHINGDEFWKDVDKAEDTQGKQSIFKNFIKTTLKNILKMEQVEVIDDRADFQTLGIDSLMMLEVKNALQNVLGSRLTLTANQMRDCSCAADLANRLVDILEGKGE